MLRPAGTEQDRQQQLSHTLTVAQLCVLALAACGDDSASAHDARPTCDMLDTHDEDGDGVVDVCDNCPAIANPGQQDLSEDQAHAFPDGVGDACDPRPGAGGDVLRGFYSFASPAQASAWTGSGFSIDADALHATGTAAWTSARAQMGDGYFVLARVASLSTTTGALVIALDGDGVSSGAACRLEPTGIAASEAGGGAPTSAMLATAIAPDEALTLVAWRTISLSGTQRIPELTCRVIHGGEMKEVSLRLTDELVTGSHVIATSDAAVDITSLSVYTSPVPKNP